MKRFGLFVAVAAAALIVCSPAHALIVGFAQTHEIISPKFGPIKDATYPAERGYVEVWTSNASIIPDPSGVSRKGLELDGTLQVSEAHIVFTHNEKTGISHTKIDTGAGMLDTNGAVINVVSGATGSGDQQMLPVFQYLSGGRVMILGEIANIDYPDIYGPEDNDMLRINFYLNFADWNITATIDTLWNGEQFEYGPMPMSDHLAQNGISEYAFYVPGGTGKYFFDGMVCIGGFLPAMPGVGGSNGSW